MKTNRHSCTGYPDETENHSSLALSRRRFIWSTAGLLAASRFLYAQDSPVKPPPPGPSLGFIDRRAAVGLTSGESRRANVCQSLVAIEDQILPVLRTKKRVVIKPNIVNTTKQLAATHLDTLHGILDFLGPRFKGPVTIAESSAGYSTEGYSNFNYSQVLPEHKPLEVSLVDLNEEGKYETHTILDGDLHAVPIRLAARLVDPEAFIICSAMLKTHNTVVATLSIKNMALGAPLHSPEKQTPRWNDKRLFHGGVRQSHVDIMLTAQKLQPFWGVAVIDGFEGMEGEGPSNGTPVASRLAIASTDFIAADRVALEAMGIDPSMVGYLNFCAQAGLGQMDLQKIDIRGPKLAGLAKKYHLHKDIERELQWQGPMKEVPVKLG
jgi:uncharacterized protein (DUF362 family)